MGKKKVRRGKNWKKNVCIYLHVDDKMGDCFCWRKTCHLKSVSRERDSTQQMLHHCQMTTSTWYNLFFSLCFHSAQILFIKRRMGFDNRHTMPENNISNKVTESNNKKERKKNFSRNITENQTENETVWLAHHNLPVFFCLSF